MTRKPQTVRKTVNPRRILNIWCGAYRLRAVWGMSRGLRVGVLRRLRTERSVGGPKGSGGVRGEGSTLGLLRNRAEASRVWPVVASVLNGVAVRAVVA
jgi:hypothetical protein